MSNQFVNAQPRRAAGSLLNVSELSPRADGMRPAFLQEKRDNDPNGLKAELPAAVRAFPPPATFDPETLVTLFDVDKDDHETAQWTGPFSEFAVANVDSYDAEELAAIVADLVSTGERWTAGFVGCLTVLRLTKDGAA